MILDNGYVIGATSARAVAQFVAQFGHAPARVYQAGRWRWLAGPVDESARRGMSGAGQSGTGAGKLWRT
jgi:hypothetical protein